MAKLKIIPEKHPMPEQEPAKRVKNFKEVPLGYSEEAAIAEASRCIQCKHAPCIAGCPVQIDIPAFIKSVQEGNFEQAARKIKEKNFLPSICGRVCPQEDQCEKVCTLAIKHQPVAIGRLERFVADYERLSGKTQKINLPKQTRKKVAIVGAGPAGLTAAGELRKAGHDVTVYEALHTGGGVLVYGIPEFRLPKSILGYEIDFLKQIGVKFSYSHVIGMIETVDELLGHHDAVFIGTGAGLPYFMGIPGENYNGVYSANEYLTRVNLMKAYLFPKWDTPIKKSGRVAVIGGGNVAMDSARTALRLGAEKVHIVYRRSRDEMPARIEEVEHAEQEGIAFNLLQAPIKINADKNGWVSEMTCMKMQLGEPDSSGRRRPIPMKNSEFALQVDTVVIAIGQGPNPLIPSSTPDLEIGKWGNIIAETTTGQTSKKGVFAGGDIVTGGATVILAMGAGKIAARAINEFLK
ncbi:NADPH-dependent glutamate synthase [candidate division KSB1 bacterium]|nr:NADPH-dependent glutamate synthase [candidate division KSB1 bacterium]